MKKTHRVLCTLVVCSLVSSDIAQPLPAGAVPFRITSKSISAVPPTGPLHEANYTLTLRNEADKAITAWKLSCLYAENDGNFSVASVQEDSFLQYERGIRSKDDRDGPVFPGDVREITVSREEGAAAGPYEAMSCQVDAVIFADGSYSGVTSVTGGFFDARARMATDAQQAIDVLDRMIEGERFSETKAMTLAEDFAETLHKADLWARAGDSVKLRQLREELRERVEVIEKHLPRRGPSRDVGVDYLKEGIR